jgi:hypothetical protein
VSNLIPNYQCRRGLHSPLFTANKTTDDRVTKSFTSPRTAAILTPIATGRNRPSCASLHIAQYELNGNAGSVHANLGDGLHGHLALTITTPEYLALSKDIALVSPDNPTPNPAHPTGATAIVINEANIQ